MIVFNTTFHLDDDIHSTGIEYIKHTYIAKSINSGFLIDPKLFRIHKQHEEQGASYSVQFRVKNIDTLNFWMEKEGQQLQREMLTHFGNKITGFSTLLDEIDI